MIKYIFVVVLVADVFSFASGLEFSTKFKLHPGALIKVLPEYHFYDQLVWALFDIPQIKKNYTLPKTTVKESDPSYKLFKTQSDFTSTFNSFQQAIRTEGVHHIYGSDAVLTGSTGNFSAEWYGIQSDKASPTSFYGPSNYNYIFSDNARIVAEDYFRNTGTDVLTRPERAIPAIIASTVGPIAKLGSKIALHTLPNFLYKLTTREVKEKQELFSTEEYRQMYADLLTVPDLVAKEYRLIDDLVTLQKDVETLLDEFARMNTDHFINTRYYLREFLKILLVLQVEVGENAEAILVLHSNGMCQAGYLPITAVPRKFFSSYYTNYSATIRRGRKMLVDIDDLDVYYKQPFSQCQIDSEGGLIYVPFMQVPENTDYKLYELTPIVHKYAEKGHCNIVLRHTSFLYDGKSQGILPVDKNQLYSCLGGTKYCKIPTVYEVRSRDLACAAGLITSNWAKIRECEIVCNKKERSSLQVSHQTNTLFLTNMGAIEIKLNDGSVRSFHADPYYGALQVQIPCHSSVTIPKVNYTFAGSLDTCAWNSFEIATIASPAYFPKVSDEELERVESTEDLRGLKFGRYFQPNVFQRLYNEYIESNLLTRIVAIATIVGGVLQVLYYSIMAYYSRRLRVEEDDIAPLPLNAIHAANEHNRVQLDNGHREDLEEIEFDRVSINGHAF